MAVLRIIYDTVVILTFYLSGLCVYYQHYSYEYSTHPLTVITCKVVAIMLIILSVNLFFSCFVNNFIYVIPMKEVGSGRYLVEDEDPEEKEQEIELSNELENEEHAPVGGDNNQEDAENVENKDVANVENKDAANVENKDAANVKNKGAAVEESKGAAVEESKGVEA